VEKAGRQKEILHGYEARASGMRSIPITGAMSKQRVLPIGKASEQGEDGKSRVSSNIIFLWPNEMERA
jgi:hypothetical protein